MALGIPAHADWDDRLTKARAALNWEKHFELAFDTDTARAYHDEDLDVDTDFCAMCGHDWCSADYVSDEEARRIQQEKVVQINTAPAHNLPSEDRLI